MASAMTPPAQSRDFLDAAGWQGSVIEPVAGDASFRRYFRVRRDEESAILMDAPPPHEDPKPFIAIANHLCEQNFAAPRILAKDLTHGLVLIEDFGDRRMREYLDDNPAAETELYTRAVDELIRLHREPAAALPAYDMEAYARETSLLTEWFCPGVGLDVDSKSFDRAWNDVLTGVLERQSPPVTVLRDYHSENLMLLDDNRLGLLDFQDALAGHPSYDLVSLLQDARRDVSPSVETAMLDHYLAEAKGQSSDAFRADYAILGAQRNTKIIGIFTRLWQRDGKPRYLDFLPRMWGLLERDLAHPSLEPVARWFADNIPDDARRNGHSRMLEQA